MYGVDTTRINMDVVIRNRLSCTGTGKRSRPEVPNFRTLYCELSLWGSVCYKGGCKASGFFEQTRQERCSGYSVAKGPGVSEA